MKSRIKSISYLKAHAHEVNRDLANAAPPQVITRNGEAKAVLQNITSYAETQEQLALFKLLAMAREDIVAGRVLPLAGLKDRIRESARHSLPIDLT